MKLPKTLQAWNTEDFEGVFKQEFASLDGTRLPLQAGMTGSSYACGTEIQPVVLNVIEQDDMLYIKTGVFYKGIIAGSCCSDDPGAIPEQVEYCEIQLAIDKSSAITHYMLLET